MSDPTCRTLYEIVGIVVFLAASVSALEAEKGDPHTGPFVAAPVSLAADLNAYWRTFGLGLYQTGKEPMLGGRKWWGIPVSASDCDWTELKLAWHDDPETLRSLRQWLFQIPIEPNGYVWAAADGRKHLNHHTLWHTNADFINAIWECWRWNGDPAVLSQVPDYAVGIEAEDGAAQTLHDATDFVHFIHGDGMGLSQTFRSPKPFGSARAKIAANEKSQYELRLYAADASEPVVRKEFKGLEGSAKGWTSLPCPAVQPPGVYRLELRNLKRYHHERVAWYGSERDLYRGGTSAQNGLAGLSLLDRARLAMKYLLDDAGMRGTADGIVTIPDPNHTGTPQPTEKREGVSMPSTYYDLVRSGHKEAFVNLRYLKALDSLAKLEEAAGDTARAEALRKQLSRAREAFHKTFWGAKTRRYAGWVDANGTVWDYGEVEVNLEALLFAAPPPEAAKSILDWISGRRIVEGDTSIGADLYFWKFAPRKNTLAYETLGTTNHWWGGWFWDFRPDGSGRANFGNQEENGGTNPFIAYYDVLARLQYLGAEDAWRRFAGDETSTMGEFRKDQLHRPTPIDRNHPKERYKAYVLDLPEAGLPPLAVLHGFLGVNPDGRVLRIRPSLPKGVERLGVREVAFQGRTYGIEMRADGSLRVQAGRGSSEALDLAVEGLAANSTVAITVQGPDAADIAETPASADAGGRVTYRWAVREGAALTFRPPHRP